MPIKPLGDRIVVKSMPAEEKTSGGIILPENAKEKPQQGKVIEVGQGRILDDGAVKSLDIKKGDKVLYSKYAGTEVKVDEQEYLIMREEDVLAVVEE